MYIYIYIYQRNLTFNSQVWGLLMLAPITIACSLFLQDIVQRATEVPTNSNDRPLLPVKIVYSDTLPVDAPFEVEKAGVEL